MFERLSELTQKQKIIIAILIIIILVLVGIYVYFSIKDKEITVLEENTENQSNQVEEKEEEKVGIIQKAKEETIIVHVIGEVNNPGVIYIKKGSRIIDAIKEAGGETENADLSKINLAYELEDGVQLRIPNKNEKEDEEYIFEDSGENVIRQSNIEKGDDLININLAKKEQLQELPGIGEATAIKIIEYRNENGKFSSIEDIKNVKGIGEAKFNNIKDKITV